VTMSYIFSATLQIPKAYILVVQSQYQHILIVCV
jgi:hypothetical protein